MLELDIAIILVLITAIIGPMINIRYKSYLESKKPKEDPIYCIIKSNMVVDEMLEKIQEDFKSDRVWLSQFHNGGHFFPTGKAITKFSVMFEHIKLGVESKMSTFTSIPVSLFNKPLMELYKNNQIIIPSFTSKNSPTFGLKTFAEGLKTKSSYIFALKTIEGDFIGTFGIDYVHKTKKLNEEQISELSDKAISLGTLIGTYLYDEKIKPKKNAR